MSNPEITFISRINRYSYLLLYSNNSINILNVRYGGIDCYSCIYKDFCSIVIEDRICGLINKSKLSENGKRVSYVKSSKGTVLSLFIALIIEMKNEEIS